MKSALIQQLEILAGEVVQFPRKAAPIPAAKPTHNTQTKPEPVAHKPLSTGDKYVDTHHRLGKAFSKAENEYVKAAAKWHHSVAKTNLFEHKKHLKAGNTKRAAEHLEQSKHHKDIAEKIEDGKLRPSFVDDKNFKYYF